MINILTKVKLEVICAEVPNLLNLSQYLFD